MADFKFIDLFAGIGGFRRALTAAKGECVFSSEWDRFAKETYEANFHEVPSDDITKIQSAEIPSHHLLAAGFPCQPFSLAGVSKKNSLGRLHGFSDLTQGTLFFDIQRIIADHRPDVVLLENVKHLERHDGGKTFEVIRATIEDVLGYRLFYKVIDASAWVPQRRQRIFMVAFRDHGIPFEFPAPPKQGPTLVSILDKKVDPKYTLTDHLWQYLQGYAKKHAAKGNGFGCSVFGPDDVARTLSARYHKDGSEVLISQGRNKNPRRLTPRECARLMGYPESHIIPVSDTQAYRQFGNSLVVPVAKAVVREIVRVWSPAEALSKPRNAKKVAA